MTVTERGYVLDGIQTAMAASVDSAGRGWIRCRCGYTESIGSHDSLAEMCDIMASLRFHYEHCPKARGDFNAEWVADALRAETEFRGSTRDKAIVIANALLEQMEGDAIHESAVQPEGEMRRVPYGWQVRVFTMMEGWSNPKQVIPSDLDRWIALLQEARAAVTDEIVVETPRKQLRGTR